MFTACTAFAVCAETEFIASGFAATILLQLVLQSMDLPVVVQPLPALVQEMAVPTKFGVNTTTRRFSDASMAVDVTVTIASPLVVMVLV